MKRPVLVHTLALIVGILYGKIANDLLGLLLFLLFVMLGASLWKRQEFKISPFVMWGSLFFLILGTVLFRLSDEKYSNLFLNLDGEGVRGYGVVISTPDYRGDSTRYVVDVNKLWSDKRDVSYDEGRIILSVRDIRRDYELEYGDLVVFEGTLRKPFPKRNPGGFDYAFYLKTQRTSGLVYTQSNDVEVLQNDRGNFIISAGISTRQSIIEIVNKFLNKDTAPLLNGILIGHRQDIATSEQEAFRRAGLTHIMAVSGAHVAFFIFPLLAILKWVGFKRRYIYIVIMLLLWVFVFVTGFSPSVLRAVIMANIVFFAKIIKRETDFFSSISFTAMLLLIFNPFNVFRVSFLLSFAATLSIVMFYSKIKRILNFKYLPDILKSILAVTISAQIGIIPITAYFFNSVQLISIITNTLVFPIVGIVHFSGLMLVLLGSLSFPGTFFVAGFVELLLYFILIVTRTFASFDYALINVMTPNIFFIILYCLFFVLLYNFPRFFKKNKLFVGTSLGSVVILFILFKLLLSPLEVVFLDVGQGDSIFVRTPKGKNVLIDGGGFATGGESDMGKNVVIPFLYHKGVRKIDIMFCSHAHADHLLGLISVIEEFRVDNLVLPSEGGGFEDLKLLAKNKNINVLKVTKGDIIEVDGDSVFKIFHPEFGKDREQGKNYNSIVKKLLHKDSRFLFTGDMYASTENKVLRDGFNVSSDVLKVSHHGSDTSSEGVFLDSVAPSVAVIKVGRNNFYGHPTPKVLDRLYSRGIKVYRTDLDGAIIMSVRGGRLRVRSMLDR